MPKFTTIFKIRIVYKSGYTHDFEVNNFEVNRGTYTWDAVSEENNPLKLGVDDIAAIWQIGTRKRLTWE
jgi:hypothetical protein